MSSVERRSKKASRKIAEIEKAIKDKLTKFYNKNIRNKQQPVAILRRLYEREVKNEIKKTVFAAYGEGISTLDEEIRKNTSHFPLFLSSNDIGNIDALTDKYNEQFWSTTNRLHDREIAPPTKLDPETGEVIPLELFDVAAALIGISALLAWGAFNQSVVSKTQEVTNELTMTPLPITIRGPTGTTTTTTTTINIPVSSKLTFMTKEDAKVDKKVCLPLHGMEFDAFDPQIPQLPLHNHCRCKWIPTVDMSLAETITT